MSFVVSTIKEKTKGKNVQEIASFLLGGAIRFLLSKVYLRNCTKLGRLVMINEKPLIVNKGVIELGDNVSIWSSVNQTKLFVEKGGILTIGNNTNINGAHISASVSVTIGKNVRIAPYVIIIDDDYHDANDHLNADGKKAPIVIEDDVWIAMDAKILKGVTIGKGSVVATSAVVTKNVPPYCIVAGVPAKVIKQIPH